MSPKRHGKMSQEAICTVREKKHERRRFILEYPGHAFQPEDLLRFVHLKWFEKGWEDLGLDDDDLAALQVLIMLDPQGSPMVPGTGGLRKLRFAPARWRVGKRGAIRVGYCYLHEFGTVLLLTAYGKNEKDNITPTERKAIHDLIRRVEKEFEDGVIT